MQAKEGYILLTMASLVHPSSAESVISQLDLFSVPASQTSLEDGRFTEYRPISILASEGPFEFCIAAEASSYIDFANTFLYVKAAVTTDAGTNLEANEEVAPKCNFLRTLLSHCDLFLNGTLVTQSNNNYPYRAYIESLLSFGKEAKDSQLSSILWYRNTAGHFDERNDANLGYTKRKELAANSRQFLNGVEIRIRLIRSKNQFCLHGDNANTKISWKDVALFCRKVKPNPAVQLAHTKALFHGTAKYPLRRVEVKTFTVPQGNCSISKENLFLGQLPTRLVFGVVDKGAYNGVMTKSPFNFKHNHINFVAIYRDGVQIPRKPLQPDFASDCFIRSYFGLYSQTGQYSHDTGNGISREQYKKGCALFAFD